MRIMRRLVLALLFSSLALTIVSMHYGGISTVRASPDMFQGDLVLTGNNVTVIEGQFDINGSIMVEGNATLILRNAIVNFTQTGDDQFGMTFQNPANGNPRLIVENATLMSAHTFSIYFYGNSSCVANDLYMWPVLYTGIWWYLYDSSSMSIAYSTVYSATAYSDALFEADNCYMRYLSTFDSVSANVSSTYVESLTSFDSADVIMSDSTMYSIDTGYGSLVQLVNSTYSSYTPSDISRITVSWYLGVNVVDMYGAPVESANVTAYYPNPMATQSRLTNVEGFARLTLIEKLVNATGEYAFGNYTVEAVYDVYSNVTAVNMTGNQQIALKLEGFAVPEFPLHLILPLLIIATLIAVMAFERKQRKLQQP
jgi:hypothetical protein